MPRIGVSDKPYHVVDAAFAIGHCFVTVLLGELDLVLEVGIALGHLLALLSPAEIRTQIVLRKHVVHIEDGKDLLVLAHVGEELITRDLLVVVYIGGTHHLVGLLLELLDRGRGLLGHAAIHKPLEY